MFAVASRLIGMIIISSMLLFSLAACTHTSTKTPYYTPASLAQGRKHFVAGQYKTAFSQLIPYAVRGNAEAEYAIGYMYYYGKGVDKNHEIAESWMRRAAGQKHSPAIKFLANIKPKKQNSTLMLARDVKSQALVGGRTHGQ